MIILAGVPQHYWQKGQTSDFFSLFEETKQFQQRISKIANQQRNAKRLDICRQAIWRIASESLVMCENKRSFSSLLERNHFPATTLNNITCEKEMAEIPFAADPNEKTTYLEKLSKLIKRSNKWFLKEIETQECGFILLPDIYPENPSKSSAFSSPAFSDQRIESQNIAIAFGENIEFNPISPIEIENEMIIFKQEVEQSLRNNTPVNVGSYHHPVLTEGLHHFIYSENINGKIGIIYEDNSQSKDYPIKHRMMRSALIDEAESKQPLRCALMSIRHMEMDAVVDIAWFNNRETSLKGVPSSQIDEVCYKRSLELFLNLPKDHLNAIWIYQTGFQPPIISFYRALIEILERGSPRVAVKPMIFQGYGQYRPYAWWI